MKIILIISLTFFFLFSCISADRQQNLRMFALELNFSDEYAGSPSPENFLAMLENAAGYADSLKISYVHDSALWSLTEPEPDVLTDPENKYEILNYYLTENSWKLFLTLCSPVNTTVKDCPPDLTETAFDSEVFITRFKLFLNFILGIGMPDQFPDCGLPEYLIIGNEIDIYLEQHPDETDAFFNFFGEIAEYIKKHYPEIKLSFTATLKGAVGSFKDEMGQNLNTVDFLSLTYYPLSDGRVKEPDSVYKDFEDLISAYPDIPIIFQEAGYPTSSVLNSSEDKQKEFIINLFQAWDKYCEHIKLISWCMLSDWPDYYTDQYLSYLGLSGDRLLAEFVSTLGLRTYKNGGTNKSGFDRLISELDARNWSK